MTFGIEVVSIVGSEAGAARTLHVVARRDNMVVEMWSFMIDLVC